MYLKSNSIKFTGLLFTLCFTLSILLPVVNPNQQAEAMTGEAVLLKILEWYGAKKLPDQNPTCIKCEEEMENKGDHFCKSCDTCKKHYWTCSNTDNLSEPHRSEDHEEITCSICEKKYMECAKTENGESVGTALHGEGKCDGNNDDDS